MAAPTYLKQLEEAKEALALIVKGQLASSSTLAGSFSNFTPEQVRTHIEWLEVKAREECLAGSPNRAGTRYVAYAGVRSV
jgi:hypothetical protein